jgi:hypothetical protein
MQLHKVSACSSGFVLAAGISVAAISPASAETELLVYTAVEADELSMFKEEFEKE